jgi:hypothetical protein
MIASLRLLRQGFWQPELAGSYLKRPSTSLDQAILLCAQNGRHQDALTFIEETKSQTTARRKRLRKVNPKGRDQARRAVRVLELVQVLRKRGKA